MSSNLPETKKIIEFIRSKLPDGGMICVTGVGAAGKTTLINQILALMGDEADSYNFDRLLHPLPIRRGIRDPNGELVTGYHPSAVHKVIAHFTMQNIKKKKETPLFSYDDKKTITKRVGDYIPKKYNFIDGIGALHHGLHRFYDLIIFIECDLETERQRRLDRDIIEKKQTINEIEKIIRLRRSQFEKFVQKYKSQADIIITSNLDATMTIEFKEKEKL